MFAPNSQSLAGYMHKCRVCKHVVHNECATVDDVNYGATNMCLCKICENKEDTPEEDIPEEVEQVSSRGSSGS